MDEVMYKTDIDVLIKNLTPSQKDRMLKDIILTFRKEGNNYVLGSKVRESLRKNLELHYQLLNLPIKCLLNHGLSKTRSM